MTSHRSDLTLKASQLGTAIHRACHFLNDDDLKWTSLDPEIRGYVEAYDQFRRIARLKVSAHEERIYHPVDLYATTLDVRGSIELAKHALIEIKTGPLQPQIYATMFWAK